MADHGVIVDEVEAAYRRYVEVFNRHDATEVAELYDRPHAQLIGEIGLSIVHDDGEQQQWYDFVMAYLDEQGWGRTEIDEMWVWPLSHSLAQLGAAGHAVQERWFRPESRPGELTLRRRDSSWKVVLSFPLLEDPFDVPGVTRSVSRRYDS